MMTDTPESVTLIPIDRIEVLNSRDRNMKVFEETVLKLPDPRKDETMNDLSTVKPLYPGAFPQPDTDDSDAPYPKAPLNLTLGFDLETFQIPLDELMPSKKVAYTTC